MEKVASILSRLDVDFCSHARITDESFASEVYLIESQDNQKILKFSHSSIKFWRELKTIEFLIDRLPVPKILSHIDPEEKMNGAILMLRMPGKPISSERLDSNMAEKCGILLGQLHSIPSEKLGSFQKEGFEVSSFRNWWDYRKDLVLGSWTKLIESKVDQDFLKRSKKFLNSYYDSFSEAENCFIHCDFRPGNIMADFGNVIGLIDFESSRTGDAAYDFIKFHEEIGNNDNLWNSFLNGYSSIKNLPELGKSLLYYEFELNYGFLQWAIARSDQRLFEERLSIAKSILDRNIV